MISRSKRIWFAAGALILCVLGVLAVILWPREPRYEGRRLSYWLDRLRPTVITRFHSLEHWPDQKFRSQAAVSAWSAETKAMEERSARVLQNAGPECLPILLARLTDKRTRIRTGFLQRCAYRIGLTDSVPVRSEDYTEVRRGQALTAIVLLGDRAAALVPHLSAIAAEDKDDAVHRAASHALFRIAPDEFRRIRALANIMRPAEPGQP